MKPAVMVDVPVYTGPNWEHGCRGGKRSRGAGWDVVGDRNGDQNAAGELKSL